MRIEPTSPVSRADRVQLGRPATMRDPSRAPVDVVVRDLSTTGALLEAADALPVGALVSLGIAGAGLQVARVARDAPGGVAIEFMLPLDPRVIAAAGRTETLVSVAFPQMIVERAAAGIDARTIAPLVEHVVSEDVGAWRPGTMAQTLVAAAGAMALLFHLVR